VFGSRGAIAAAIAQAMRQVEQEGRGRPHMRQEGRGIGLAPKILAYKTERGYTRWSEPQAGFPKSTCASMARAQILVDLGLRDPRLLTNNEEVVGPKAWLGDFEQVPIQVRRAQREIPENETREAGHLFDAYCVLRMRIEGGKVPVG
jgi:3,4-dihydroxy 2-butanone 4-phosphate synthase/GTP cyclohydrolase II